MHYWEFCWLENGAFYGWIILLESIHSIYVGPLTLDQWPAVHREGQHVSDQQCIEKVSMYAYFATAEGLLCAMLEISCCVSRAVEDIKVSLAMVPFTGDIWFPINLPSQVCLYLAPFLRYYCLFPKIYRGHAVAQRVERWTCDHGFKSYSGQKLRNNLGQVVHTYVPLSPSSITWYQPRGGDALWLGRYKPCASLAQSSGSLPPGGWFIVTCRLTACTLGSVPGPNAL